MVVDRYKADLDPEPLQRVLEQGHGRAVYLRSRDDMIPRRTERREGGKQRAHSRSGTDTGDTALQRGHALFQNRHGGVGHAAVYMPTLLDVEQGSAMIDVLEHVGGGLIDRHRPAAVLLFRQVAAVQGDGFG